MNPLDNLAARRDRTVANFVALLRGDGLADQRILAVAGPRVRIGDRWVLNFASTNYLGLSRHPLVARAAARAAGTWGMSLSTPRVLGVDRLTCRLEAAIARLVGQERALVFPSTTHAALDVLPRLAGPRGTLFVDEWAYSLSLAGAYLAARNGARQRRFPHNDAGALARLMANLRAADMVVVCDGVYPATGRTAQLRSFAHVAHQMGAVIYVDDAHGVGLLGAGPTEEMPYGCGGGGTPAHQGLAAGAVAHVGSLSKAFGVPVAFVAGPARFIAYLRAEAPTFTHSSPPALPVLAAALASLRIHEIRGDDLRCRLAGLVRRLQRGLLAIGLPTSPGNLFPIQAIQFPIAATAYATARALRHHDIWALVQPGPHGNPAGAALRFVVTAAHEPADIDRLLEALARCALARFNDGNHPPKPQI